MKRTQNILLLIGVIALAILPLMMVAKPAAGPDGQAVEIFTGADDKAKDLISEINPEYQPWFSSIIEPASGEIASMLFALQAALGAGFIGYYIGGARMREKMQREQKQREQQEKQGQC